ncbi:MAG: HdeD family acid-resistance protein [Chthoniobacterales bacterium]
MIPQVSRSWSIVTGIAMIILGFIALSDQIVATAVVATFIGVILLLGCAFSLVKIFTIQGWKNHFWYVFVAIAYGIAGYIFIGRPFVASIVFTLVLGWAILIGGIFRTFMAFKLRHHKGALWILFSAIISIILGGMIISQWPGTGFYILGLFLGIELIFAGAGWMGLGFSTPKEV